MKQRKITRNKRQKDGWKEELYRGFLIAAFFSGLMTVIISLTYFTREHRIFATICGLIIGLSAMSYPALVFYKHLIKDIIGKKQPIKEEVKRK